MQTVNVREADSERQHGRGVFLKRPIIEKKWPTK